MHIDHIALWADDLDLLKDFYRKYFKAECTPEYCNESKQYRHHYLVFPDGGSRLEIMNQPGHDEVASRHLLKGFAHLCICIGTKEDVLSLTDRLIADGYNVISMPRTTGEGSFEAAVLDPEGNYIEYSAAK